MIARTARLSDVDALLKLSKEAHKRSRYQSAPFNEKACRDAIRLHIGMGLPPSLGATAIFVAEGRKIEAALTAVCVPLYNCLGAILITDVFWYAGKRSNPRAGVAVLNAFHDWADQCPSPYVVRQGVTDFIASDPDRTGHLLERKGFRKAGLIYEKERLT